MKFAWILFATALIIGAQGQVGIESTLRRLESAIQSLHSKMSDMQWKVDEIYSRLPQEGVILPIKRPPQYRLPPPAKQQRPKALKLEMKVSGRNLADKDSGLSSSDRSDPFFKIYVSTDNGATKELQFRSDTINNSENPEWRNTFEFNFDRGQNQWLQFEVLDHDSASKDEVIGRVWVNVADYVDKGQLTYAKLDRVDERTGRDEGSYLKIEAPRRQPGSGQLDLPPGKAERDRLTFQVSATNLPTKDDVGPISGRSDPYVIITSMEGISGEEINVGRSKTLKRESNPSWDDEFVVNWSKRKDQRLHLVVWDDDSARTDDILGSVWIELNDYVAKDEFYTMPLGKQGTITIRKVRGPHVDRPTVPVIPGPERPQSPTLKLEMKVSGKNLADKDSGLAASDKSDPFYEIFLSTDNGATKGFQFRSDIIDNSENPEWNNVFEFNFDRRQNQWLQFGVYDHDSATANEVIGRVWVNVADYVDKGQLTYAKLDRVNDQTGEDEGSYIKIESARRQPGPLPSGRLPLPFGKSEPRTLTFKVSATNVPTKDDFGFFTGKSDPYVIITYTEGLTGKEITVGRSTTLRRETHPQWNDQFVINWDKEKNQRLHFVVWDDDNARRDDILGSAWIEVNDYVSKNEMYTMPLGKQGTITIRKVS